MGETLISSLCLVLLLFAVGVSWGWPIPAPGPARGGKADEMTEAASRIALTGLVILVLVVLFLGELGIYKTPVPWLIVIAGITAVGALAGLVRHPAGLKRLFMLGLPVFALLAGGVVLVMSFWPSSEWIIGGWDPGVYINEGVSLENRGTLHPRDAVLSKMLEAGEREHFTRTGRGRTERFPGVIADTGRGAFSFEFFRLMPAAVALAARCGGLRGALSLNAVLGLLSVLALLALLVRSSSRAHAFFSAVVMCTQSIWIYHTRTPVSEMLHLVLVLAAGTLLLCRRDRFAHSLPLTLLLFALVLNRYSFIPFAGILLVILSILDGERPGRKTVLRERTVQVAAVMAAMLLNHSIAPFSLRGWGVLPYLMALFAGAAGAALLLDASAPRWTALTGTWKVPLPVSRAAGSAFLGFLAVFYLVGRFRPTSPDSDNVYRLVAYTGVLPSLCVIAGGVLVFRHRARFSGPFKGFLLFLFLSTTVLLLRKMIVDVYPWATRRYLPYTVPLVSVLAGYPLAVLWRSNGGLLKGKAWALSLTLALLLSTATTNWHALSRTEYKGASAALSDLAEQIGEEDVVVVDSPGWGTPLTFIHRKHILNGKPLWRFQDSEKMKLGLRSLARLRAEGRTIRFLTTTEARGLDMYPLAVEPATLDWESGPFSLRKIDHSARGTDFLIRSVTYHFRLFTWGRNES